MDYAKKFLDFIKESKTPYHAVKNLSDILDKNGYKKLYESNSWKLNLGEKYYVTKKIHLLLPFHCQKILVI